MDKPVRILIAESGSGYGGTAKYLAGLLPLLNRNLFAVEIAAYADGPFIQQIKKAGWAVRHFENWGFPHLMRAPQIAAWIRKSGIQLVHLNNEIHSHIPLILGAKLAGCKILCHLHGWRSLTRIEKWAGRFVDQFIAVTKSGAAFYREQLGGRDVIGIPNGIHANGKHLKNGKSRLETRRELGVDPGDFLAVLIGRLIPLKGHSVFFQALAKAGQAKRRLRGLVVGNDPSPAGTFQLKLEKQLYDLGLQEKVQFVPWRENLDSIYEASDAVIQPSVQPESFGYVALEGMMAGKPVVASKTGGLVDLVVNGKTGLLVEPGDSSQLATAMMRIAEDRDYAKELGTRGKERALNLFNMERNAKSIQELYERLLR